MLPAAAAAAAAADIQDDDDFRSHPVLAFCASTILLPIMLALAVSTLSPVTRRTMMPTDLHHSNDDDHE
jgi:hypothetical protein